MDYQDIVYGKISITEPIIQELIKSPSIQRLKGIDQAGYTKAYFSNIKHTRYEHSLGVYILLNKYHAPLEEQIAGLIHDVSHSAFSHCIDYVRGYGSEKSHNHQDKIFKNFVKKTNIPKILKKYHIDLECILDEKNFPIKERLLPDLCADRIDYSLRTALVFNEISQEDINYYLKNLIVKDSCWVFQNYESAKKFADLFFFLNKKYFSGLLSALMFKTVGDYLTHALTMRYINEDDLYHTDKFVLSKINKHLHKDKKLKLLFERMNNKKKMIIDKKIYDVHVFCKSRAIDPFFQHKSGLKRLSMIDKKWVRILTEEKKPKEYFIKFSD